MLGLTLRHPWPFAILFLGKSIENRDWSDDFARNIMKLDDAMHQPLAIHGGKAPKRGNNRAWRDFEADVDWIARMAMGEPAVMRAWRAHFKGRDNRPVLEDFILPGIVGVAQISRADRTGTGPWAVPGALHLHLSDVQLISQPVPHRGALGFWEVEYAAQLAVRQQLPMMPSVFQSPKGCPDCQGHTFEDGYICCWHCGRELPDRQAVEAEARDWLGL